MSNENKARAHYDYLVRRGLKPDETTTPYEARESLEAYIAFVLTTLLDTDEETLQRNCQSTDWFVYKMAAGQPDSANLYLRTANQEPQRELDIFCSHDIGEEFQDLGHRLIISNQIIVPGEYHENFPMIAVPRDEIADGIEPDGEWIIHRDLETAITSFRQYPWQARKMMARLTVETGLIDFDQSELRRYHKNGKESGVRPFLTMDYLRGGLDPVWNTRYAEKFYKAMRDYARILRPILFGND